MTFTSTQKRVLGFVAEFQAEHGRTPTGPEIADQFGYNAVRSVYQHLRLIEKKGYLSVVQPGSRKPLQIHLTDKARRLLQMAWPQSGRIPAGPVTEVGVDVDRSIEELRDLLPMVRAGDFFLTVEGDSMANAGLKAGMTLLVRPRHRVQPGTICAVWVDGDGGTLKRVFPEGDMVRLVPKNENYEPAEYPPDRIQVQGALVASIDIRTFGRH